MRREQAQRFAAACITAAVLVLVDQASKAAALASLTETTRVPLLGDLLGLQLTFNPGATLSFGSSVPWLLTALGVGTVVFWFVAATRAVSTAWAVGLGFVLGGALGNVIDRLFAPPGFGRGYVTDFLAYNDWFIGNLADVALAIGLLILGVVLWVRRRPAARPVSDLASSTSAVSGR